MCGVLFWEFGYGEYRSCYVDSILVMWLFVDVYIVLQVAFVGGASIYSINTLYKRAV